MKKSSKNRIISIDPYNFTSYSFQDSLIEENDIKSFNKDDFFVSYLQTKDIISSTIEISRAIPEEDLDDAILVKAYDDMGLEGDKEYKVISFESTIKDSEDRLYNVFAIEIEKLGSLFNELKNIKYIDYLTPAPLLFKSLYNKNILESTSIDCFIYFQQNDAFVTIYKSGEYIFSKSFRYSQKVIVDTFSKSIGKRVEEKQFFDNLKVNGFTNPDSTMQQQTMKLFGEIFSYLNDVIQFAKRSNKLDMIDQIYIGMDAGNFPGLDEYCKNYLKIPTKKLEFNIAKNFNEIQIDPLSTLLVIAAGDYIVNRDDIYNATIFDRPPPFAKRPSGKLVQVLVASLILSFTYPIYQVTYNNYLQNDLKELRTKEATLSSRVSRLKNEFKIAKKDEEDVDKILSKKDKDLQFRTKLLTRIYGKKVDYPMKAKILIDLFEYINKFDTKVVNVGNIDNDITLTIASKNDKQITELMKSLSLKKEYSVTTKMIKKDSDNGYLSAIKVVLNGKF